MNQQDVELTSHNDELQKVTAARQSILDGMSELGDKKKALVDVITQYKKVVGDFQSAAKLRQYVKKLNEFAGEYKTVAELKVKIDEQRGRLEECARAMDVAADAREIIGKAEYYENLVRELKAEVESIEETMDVQQFGVYRPQYDFDHSDEYKKALSAIQDERKTMVKTRDAIEIPDGITVDGNERAGRKLGEEYAKVMLRAFNGEADAAIVKAKYNNMQMLQKRISKSRDDINKLGTTMGITIPDKYLQIRTEELKLAYEFERKKQQEREEQAELKEQAREEEKVRKQAEKARQEAEKSEEQEKARLAEKERLLAELMKEMEITRHNMAEITSDTSDGKGDLGKLLAEQEDQIASLRTQRDTLIQAVQTAHDRTEKAISLAQLTKRGHVYILSNIGSFGENRFKIGMTRRNDPNERVKELGSASVPFPFDIHAMILTNDAPALESALHQHFDHRRVNKINNRKEFFEVTIKEIENALKVVHPTPLTLRQTIPEATEYRETFAICNEATAASHAKQSPVKVFAR